MCVTANPAILDNTQTYCLATTDPATDEDVHVVAYQNKATSERLPNYHPDYRENTANVMFLDFPGTDLQPVYGPERTTGFMDGVMANVEQLRQERSVRGESFSGLLGANVVDYGDYTLVYANGPADIESALNQVPSERQPDWHDVEPFNRWYLRNRPNRSFVLACFADGASPTHPIVVRYKPHNPDELAVPGLDGHGNTPRLGQLVERNFKVAYAINGIVLPHFTRYTGLGTRNYWAPRSVVGFHDNFALNHANGDYVVRRSDVEAGLTSSVLADRLIPERAASRLR